MSKTCLPRWPVFSRSTLVRIIKSLQRYFDSSRLERQYQMYSSFCQSSWICRINEKDEVLVLALFAGRSDVRGPEGSDGTAELTDCDEKILLDFVAKAKVFQRRILQIFFVYNLNRHEILKYSRKVT